MSGLDIVPDGETALQIGKIILKRYYGEKLVNAYEPPPSPPGIVST
jgi:hypothetical protein